VEQQKAGWTERMREWMSPADRNRPTVYADGAEGLTQEWFKELCRILIPKLQKPGRGTCTYTEIWTECPGEHPVMWMHFVLNDGILTSGRLGSEEEETPEADFTVTGTYENFVEILSDNRGEKAPVVTGKLKFRGNLFRGIARLPEYARLVEAKRELSWEYALPETEKEKSE